MRYIGNKTKLLPFILRAVRRLGIAPGVAHDAFAGTAAVGRALKRAGWRVASSDVMTYSYAFQRAYVVASGVDPVAPVAAADPELRRALRSDALRRRAAAAAARANGDGGVPARRLALLGEYLGRWVEPEAGFLTAHFSPTGGRMYFTPENAARIDAARRVLHEWRATGLVGEDTYYVLLAAVLEGADRVANTAGVYAAYIKQWQPNALRPFAVLPEVPVRGRGSTAHRADAAEVARALGPVDLLYIDPPYNARQYASYYHVPEVIARGWFDVVPALRGKTGLLDVDAPRSPWCSARRVRSALDELLAASGARHVLLSYNSEGLLPHADLRATLRAHAADGLVRRFTLRYKRYRADRDHERRKYKGDSVRELLYYIRR